MITNVHIDETIVAQAMQLSGARSKREVVDRAMRELVARAIRPSVRELFGMGDVQANYDLKAPWASGTDAGHGCIEHSLHKPAARYNVTLIKSAFKVRALKA